VLSILVADDHALVRRGMRALLEAQPGWIVVAEAADGREAVAEAKQFQPDVIIMDIGMPELNGLEAAQQILTTLPGARILMLSMHDEPELIERALSTGARGYLLKSDTQEDLVSAVRAVLANRTFLSSAAMKPTTSQIRRRTAALTPRESQVLKLLAEGKTNKRIAGVLGISQRTVENHRAKIMEKLRLRSFSELVRYAVRHKIIDA
jgi:two-component system response regulator NreC